jgi:hypothetical protein
VILNAYFQGSACYAIEAREQQAENKTEAEKVEDRKKQAERKRRES